MFLFTRTILHTHSTYFLNVCSVCLPTQQHPEAHLTITVGLHECQSCQQNALCISDPDTRKIGCEKNANDIAWRQICFTTTHHTRHITKIRRNGQVITHAHTQTGALIHIVMYKFCCYCMLRLTTSHEHSQRCTYTCTPPVVVVCGHEVDFHERVMNEVKYSNLKGWNIS